MNIRAFRFFYSLSEERRSFFAGAVPVLAAFIVFLNSLDNGFVWDDNVVILENPVFRGGVSSVFFAIDSPRQYEWAPYYRPLTYLTFYLENSLFGFDPFGMHLLNLLLHAANVLLVYVIVKMISARASVAFLASILFAVHPISAESVNFLSGGRNTLLSCFFVLLTFFFYIKWVRKDRIFYLVLSNIAFFSAALSKETGVMALPLLAIAGVWFKRGKALKDLLPYFGMLGIYLLMRYYAFKDAIIKLELKAEAWTSLLDNIYTLPRYLQTVLWPGSASINYPIPEDMNLHALPILFAWLLILGFVIFILARHRNAMTVSGLAWAILFWIPTSGIYPIPSMPMADRYIYISIIGIWFLVGLFVSELSSRYEALRRFIYIPVTVAVVALSVLTIKQNTYWHDDFSLFKRYIAQYPDNPFGHYNLGTAYLEKAKDPVAAEEEFKKALALKTDFPGLMTQLGHIAFSRRDYDSALRYYDDALRRNPFEVEAIINRALVLESMGRYEDALHDYKAFLAFPEDIKPQARLMAAKKIRALEEILRK
jgi:tetratricopeptide (TPR) repeat protein